MSASGGGFKDAWRHRRWRWLLGGFTVSMTGDWLYSVALVVFLLEATDSAGWVAGAAVVRVLAYVVLGPFGGVLADRYDRRKLMMGLDLVRFALMSVEAVIVWADGPPALVVALTVVASVATTPYRPAAIAATPALVAEDDLAAANAAESVIGSVAFFVGPALGAAVVALADAGTAFLVNALTFGVSALLISRIGDAGGGRPAVVAATKPHGAEGAAGGEGTEGGDAAGDASGDGAGVLTGMWTDVRDGMAIMRRNAAVAALSVFTAAVVFQYGAEVVLHVFVATDRLGMDPSGVGVLAAAVGVGGLVVAPFSARLGSRRNAGRLLAVSGLVMGLSMVALAFTTSTAVAVVLLGIEGIGTIVFEILAITMLQRACPPGSLARVYGLQDSLTAATQLLGSALAPLLLRTIDLEGALVVSGGVMVAVAVLTAPALTRASVASDDERLRLAPVTDRLRGLGIFGDASQAALERIARVAETRPVASGQAIFTEGDAPDDLYVVLAGGYDVSTVAQGVVNQMAEGDWFGEIGLLRRLPRTATVTATADGEVLAIPGLVFIEALSVPDVLPDPLRRMMSHRLVRTHPWLVEPDDAPAPGG